MARFREARSQSAMEYLMTYGWAILIIAVVLGALYSLGIFNGANFLGGTCVAAPGYLCSNPLLATDGTLSFTYGYQGPNVTVVGFACTNTTTVPASFALSGSSNLEPGQEESVSASCSLPSGSAIGTPLSGYLWVEYDQAGQSDLIARFATISTSVRIGSSPKTLVLASGQGSPWAINVSGGNAYWTDYSSGNVMTCSVSDCSGTMVTLAQNQNNPDGIAVSNGEVYWADYNGAAIMACQASNCAGTLVTLASNQYYPNYLTVSSGEIYWTDGSAGDVMKCAVSDCPATINTIATSSYPEGIVLYGSNVYWDEDGSPYRVFECSSSSCGSPSLVAFLPAGGKYMTVSNGNLYLASGTSNGDLFECSASNCGNNPNTIITGQNNPTYIAVLGGDIYWTDTVNPGSGVMKCDASNCASTVTTISNGQGYPFGITAYGSDIYWTNPGDGNVIEYVP